MPKLLSLNSYHYRRGGSDVVYLEHDAMFAALGWQTACMSMHHPKNLVSPWDEFFVDELEMGGDYSMLRKLGMAGKVIYSNEARHKVLALLDRFTADVAHVHCIYHHLSPSVLPALKSRGVATVMTAHDLKLACPAYKMFNSQGVCERCKGGNLTHVVRQRCLHGSLAVSSLVMVESWLHRAWGIYRKHLDAVVAPSQFYRNKLVEWGWPAEIIEVIPNFADAQNFRPEFEPGLGFVYFGRLSPEKGLLTLIRAAQAAQVPLTLIGTGPQENELRVLAGSSTNIEFAGYQSGHALWDRVRAARAVVLPAEWYENAPMSVMEAYACGKPVIGANIGGMAEVIEPGVTGWLFTSAAEDELAARLADVAALPAIAVRRVGEAARHKVATQFTRERYMVSMQSLYGRLGVR